VVAAYERLCFVRTAASRCDQRLFVAGRNHDRLVCTENLIRIDDTTKSAKLAE
jgi:hypothetical protein